MQFENNTENNPEGQLTSLTRRRFIQTAVAAGLGLGATSWTGCGPSNSSSSSDLETSEVRFGIIALTDCSPIVIAHEKGFFSKYGIQSTVVKGASWASIRDSLSNGGIQATHMLLGMPLASTIGLLGSPKVPMVIPWIMNRNGQAITLKKDLRGKIQADPKALKPLVDQAKAEGSPMTFAMTFPPGTHAMWMRYYLGVGGINPDKDVALITIPPPHMIANMQVGKMDGFCVGEPWNARAISDDIGFTSVTTQDIWKDHPEKVCAFTKEFADSNPKTVKAVLKALHEASVWLDNRDNRPEGCEIVSRPTYINCPKEIILGRMLGDVDYGDGRKKKEEQHYMTFHARNCNYPQPKYAVWWLTQFRRWGMVTGRPDYEGVSREVMRTDLYEEAMKELGYQHGGRNDQPETFFDGVQFDPKDPEAYATSFAVHSMRS